MRPVLMRLVLGQSLSQTCMSGLRAALPIFALHRGYGATDVGLVLAGFSASNLLLSVPIGRLADRHGVQLPWKLSVWFAVVSAVLCAAWPTLPGLCLAAMFVGTSAALSQLAAQHHVIVTSASAQERSESIGWIMFAPAFAAFFGPAVMGLLLDWAGKTPADHQSLLAIAALVVVLAWLSGWAVRKVPNHTGGRPESDRHAPGEGWVLLRNPRFRAVLVVNALSFTCWSSFLLIVPVMAHDRGLSATMVGAILGAFALTTAVSRPLLPKLTRVIARRRLMIGMNLACALLFVGFVAVQAVWVYIFSAALLGLTLGSVQVLLATNLADESPQEKLGEAMGIRMLTYSATSVAMPIILGVAGATLGLAGVFVLTGCVAAAGAAFAVRLDRGMPHSQGKPR